MRVLILLDYYPQMSQTYMDTELRALGRRHEIKVLSLEEGTRRRRLPAEVEQVKMPAALAIAGTWKPDVVHGHYLHNSALLVPLAEKARCGFTVRAHSFDSSPQKTDVEALMRDHCLGIIAFPWARPQLVGKGISSSLIHDCWPVVERASFANEEPNGSGVMCVTSCIHYKRADEFIRLARQAPDLGPFRLYTVYHRHWSGHIEELRSLNDSLGRPIEILLDVDPDDMPAEYKRHTWLWKPPGQIGWPMAVAEAQASGAIAMVPDRPDLKLRQYVGPGFFYGSIDESIALMRAGFSPEMRSLAFEHSKKSDIESHLPILESLWSS